ALFCENFECLDDYAGTAYFASFLRMLKYTSFYLSIFLPGVFVGASAMMLWSLRSVKPIVR
ncbi:spore germination protein, partial [Faecalibacterium duncaniae]|uniref:spore germination protein n=1 Tax=Faecalibacterium duncaniae (strain DSM 17677 / JCM 31915 / A2-165) TaxID=411483 RepID=UPI0029415FDA